MLLGLYKISGHSMMPGFKPADRIVVSYIPYFFSDPKVRDIVVFKIRDKIMVKRIMRVSNGKFSLSGDNKSDSLKIKPIEQVNILGKVIFKLDASRK